MDKAAIKKQIEKVFENFEAAIQNHQDINTKRMDGGWSVGQIGNHIIKATSADFGATQKTERAFDEHAENIKETFLNFSLKFTSAPSLQPDEKTYTTTDLIKSLESNKDALLKVLLEDDLTETCIDTALPGWGNLTKYEWFVLIENHMIRHTKQVDDFVPQMA